MTRPSEEDRADFAPLPKIVEWLAGEGADFVRDIVRQGRQEPSHPIVRAWYRAYGGSHLAVVLRELWDGGEADFLPEKPSEGLPYRISEEEILALPELLVSAAQGAVSAGEPGRWTVVRRETQVVLYLEIHDYTWTLR